MYFLRICPNTRQTVTPVIPRKNIMSAAPEPFPVPNRQTIMLSDGVDAINGSHTISTIVPPVNSPIGIVKNCRVFLQE